MKLIALFFLVLCLLSLENANAADTVAAAKGECTNDDLVLLEYYATELENEGPYTRPAVEKLIVDMCHGIAKKEEKKKPQLASVNVGCGIMNTLMKVSGQIENPEAKSALNQVMAGCAAAEKSK